MKKAEIRTAVKRMVKMSKLPHDSLDRHAAWLAYSKTIDQALQQAPTFHPSVIKRLYPIILELQNEAEIIGLTEDYYDAHFKAVNIKQKLKKKGVKVAATK